MGVLKTIYLKNKLNELYTNYTQKISLTDSEIFALSNNDKTKILILAQDRITILPYNISTFSSPTFEFYVKIPVLYPNDTITLYLYIDTSLSNDNELSLSSVQRYYYDFVGKDITTVTNDLNIVTSEVTASIVSNKLRLYFSSTGDSSQTANFSVSFPSDKNIILYSKMNYDFNSYLPYPSSKTDEMLNLQTTAGKSISYSPITELNSSYYETVVYPGGTHNTSFNYISNIDLQINYYKIDNDHKQMQVIRNGSTLVSYIHNDSNYGNNQATNFNSDFSLNSSYANYYCTFDYTSFLVYNYPIYDLFYNKHIIFYDYKYYKIPNSINVSKNNIFTPLNSGQRILKYLSFLLIPRYSFVFPLTTNTNIISPNLFSFNLHISPFVHFNILSYKLKILQTQSLLNNIILHNGILFNNVNTYSYKLEIQKEYSNLLNNIILHNNILSNNISTISYKLSISQIQSLLNYLSIKILETQLKSTYSSLYVKLNNILNLTYSYKLEIQEEYSNLLNNIILHNSNILNIIDNINIFSFITKIGGILFSNNYSIIEVINMVHYSYYSILNKITNQQYYTQYYSFKIMISNLYFEKTFNLLLSNIGILFTDYSFIFHEGKEQSFDRNYSIDLYFKKMLFVDKIVRKYVIEVKADKLYDIFGN